MRKRIRGGSGLGDSLYVQAIVRYLVHERKERITVAAPHADLFKHYGDAVEVIAHCKTNMDYVAHYASRKNRPGTSQFEDCCINCGVPKDIPLQYDWPGPVGKLSADIRQRAAGKPIILLQMPRMPFSRNDPFGIELLPEQSGIQKGIDAIKKAGGYIVKIGKGGELYKVQNVDLDMSNKTTIRDLLEIANVADGGFGQVSFIIPLMESYGKPVLTVLARKGLQSKNPFISSITADKVNHYKESSWTYVDDSMDDVIEKYCQRLVA